MIKGDTFMKKYLIALTGTAAVFLFSGCGNGRSAKSDAGDTNSDTGTMTGGASDTGSETAISTETLTET